jgi:Ran GTPase-activating protein (RanGAP) involved in mRNA processing and transport
MVLCCRRILCSRVWLLFSLSHNELDYTAATAIAQMLTANQHLTHLDLSNNPLSEAGAVQLAAGIKKNAILQVLKYVL